MSQTDDQSGGDAIWCVKNGDSNGLKDHLKKNPKIVNESINGRYLLHYAADYGQVEILKELLSNGAQVNTKDKYGITPILAAIFEDHLDCVKYLLEQRADVNGKSPDGAPYEECCSNEEIRTLILKQKQSKK